MVKVNGANSEYGIDIKERDSTGLHNTSDGNHHSEGVNKLHASKCGHVGEC